MRSGIGSICSRGLAAVAVAFASATASGAAPPAPAAPPAIALPPGSPLPARSAAAPEDWRASLREFAAQHFRNPAWGASHSARVYALAAALAREDGIALDDDVLYAAAYLHDVAAFPPWAVKDLDHADVAAGIVADLLAPTAFPRGKLDAVRGAIRTHMFFRTPATGPEATYLHDADALDWLGAIGVARLVALVDPNGGAPDGPTMVQRLETNLATVPAAVLSPAGKKRVAERRAQLESFLRALREQTDDLRTL
jgi:hypothetical protein